MYYMKTEIGSKCAKIPLNDISVHTKCPECGKEQRVPFVELTEIILQLDGDFDADSTKLICEHCTARKRGERDV